MEDRKKKLYKIAILFLLVLVVVLSYFLFNREKEPNNHLNKDDEAVEWEGKQKNSQNSNTEGIAIPGFDLLVLNANSLDQKVNLYNPEVNDCLFLMTLYIDNKELWKSGYVAPGEGYYDITISQILEEGDYQGYLKVQCFKQDSTELNSAIVNFSVEVK